MKNSNWPTDDELLRKYMKIPPKKKLEWLHQMHELKVKTSTKRDYLIHWKLRGIF